MIDQSYLTERDIWKDNTTSEDIISFTIDNKWHFIATLTIATLVFVGDEMVDTNNDARSSELALITYNPTLANRKIFFINQTQNINRFYWFYNGLQS